MQLPDSITWAEISCIWSKASSAGRSFGLAGRTNGMENIVTRLLINGLACFRVRHSFPRSERIIGLMGPIADGGHNFTFQAFEEKIGAGDNQNVADHANGRAFARVIP